MGRLQQTILSEEASLTPEQSLWWEVLRAHLCDICGYASLSIEEQIHATRLARADAVAFMNGRKGTTTQRLFNIFGIDTDVALTVVERMHERGWELAHTNQQKQFGIDHIVGVDGMMLFKPRERLLTNGVIAKELKRIGVDIAIPANQRAWGKKERKAA